jgi:5'-AMP-activated protein kinase catalytic alpha subunit
MIAGEAYNGKRIDIWSSGVVLYAMICGFLPFEDPDTGKLYGKILAGEFTIPKFVSKECKDLMHRVMNTDPESRY